MKVTQISGILNDVFGQVLGDESLFAEDLSNIVTSGTIITSSTDFGDNFDNYAGKIIDKVGRTVFWDRVYQADDLGIWRDSFEYGSVLEKIRCDVGDYADNCEWDLTVDADSDGDLDYNENIATHVAELFKFYPAKVQSKYFNGKTTFKATVSITRKQLREAFKSASDMGRFIAMIENRLRTKLEISKNQLQKMTIANQIGEHIYQEKQVVDLRDLYVAEVDSTAGSMTLKQALGNGRAARFIGQKMAWFREMMKEPSKLYSATGTFFNHTPIEYSRMIVLADVDSALRFNVYGDTYNEEYVKLDNYKTVPFWQSAGTGFDSLDARSGINIKTTANHSVASNNIIGILFDRDGVMICNEEPDVRAQYNADGNFTNYLYCSDCSYYNDFDENFIVFVWGGDTPVETISPVLAAGTSGKTVVQSTGITVPASGAVYAISDTAAKVVDLGVTFTTTGYTQLSTLGTTAISTSAGKVITVVVIDSDGKAVDVGSVTVTASDVG